MSGALCAGTRHQVINPENTRKRSVSRTPTFLGEPLLLPPLLPLLTSSGGGGMCVRKQCSDASSGDAKKLATSRPFFIENS